MFPVTRRRDLRVIFPILVVNPSRSHCAACQYSITACAYGGPTWQLLLEVLIELVAVSVGSDQSAGFGIAYARSMASFVL